MQRNGRIHKKKNKKKNNNNKKKQTGDLKKTGDIKGILNARMSKKKDRNCKDLREAEGIKTQQEYTELYKNILKDPDNHDGVVTH